MISDDEFIEVWNLLGSPQLVANRLGISTRHVYAKRRDLEATKGIKLETTNAQNPGYREVRSGAVVRVSIPDGVVLVASDCHFWPGIRTTAFRAFLKFCKDYKPTAIVLNGDVFDGASISRHPSIGWEKKPSVVEELKACKASLKEIIDACPTAKRFWTLGNHDMRFETRLSMVASEYREVEGVHLKDHFPEWVPCWRLDINEDVVVKHRFKGGTHATHNNVVHAGKTIVTGHLHSLKVTPFSDYAPRPRWGVDCGTLADRDGPQFEDYLEGSPVSWRSGFAVLTFKNGYLLWPELVHKFDEDHVEFRGEVIAV